MNITHAELVIFHEKTMHVDKDKKIAHLEFVSDMSILLYKILEKETKQLKTLLAESKLTEIVKISEELDLYKSEF